MTNTEHAQVHESDRQHQLAQLQKLHLTALRAADGGSNDDEIEALQDLAEAALSMLDDYTAPEL